MQFFWIIYLCIYAGLSSSYAWAFFSHASSTHLYYFILNSFSSYFFFYYFASFSQIMLEIIHFIPLTLYIYNKNWLSREFWQILLILRLIFDITGHPYDLNQLIAVYYFDPVSFIKLFMLMVNIHIPSYIACYQYAFGRQTGNKQSKAG